MAACHYKANRHMCRKNQPYGTPKTCPERRRSVLLWALASRPRPMIRDRPGHVHGPFFSKYYCHAASGEAAGFIAGSTLAQCNYAGRAGDQALLAEFGDRAACTCTPPDTSMEVEPARRVTARLLAGPAHAGTDPAMLMVTRMPRAFFAAAAAYFRAKREHHPGDRLIGACLARANGASRMADIRAVQIHADAPAQLIDRFLGEASIGASDASLRAIEACLRRLNRNLLCLAVSPWMGVSHCLHMHRSTPVTLGSFGSCSGSRRGREITRVPAQPLSRQRCAA